MGKAAHVLLGHLASVAIAQHRFEHEAEGHRQPGDGSEPGLLECRQASKVWRRCRCRARSSATRRKGSVVRSCALVAVPLVQRTENHADAPTRCQAGQANRGGPRCIPRLLVSGRGRPRPRFADARGWNAADLAVRAPRWVGRLASPTTWGRTAPAPGVIPGLALPGGRSHNRRRSVRPALQRVNAVPHWARGTQERDASEVAAIPNHRRLRGGDRMVHSWQWRRGGRGQTGGVVACAPLGQTDCPGRGLGWRGRDRLAQVVGGLRRPPLHAVPGAGCGSGLVLEPEAGNRRGESPRAWSNCSLEEGARSAVVLLCE